MESGSAAVGSCAAGGIDLVLMDIQMPGMDGYEATRLIRQAEQEGGRERVPIVAVTAQPRRQIHPSSCIHCLPRRKLVSMPCSQELMTSWPSHPDPR